jgi:hypothetical protein
VPAVFNIRVGADFGSFWSGLLVAILTEVSNPEIEKVEDQLSRVILCDNNQVDVIHLTTAPRSRS